MTSVSNAVANRNEGPAALIEQYRDDLAMIAPSHINPNTLTRVIIGLLNSNEKLASAAASNPASFLAALMECAELGHRPGDTYHFVPFGNKITGIEDYKGEIERMYRAGAVVSVKAEVIYANDRFDWDPDTMDKPSHKANWLAGKKERGDMIGVYAYARMRDGSYSRPAVMGKEEVMEHKAVSKTGSGPDSPWSKWPRSMWLKTAVHELAKWVPTSAEYLTDHARAQGEMMRTANKPTSAPPAVGTSTPRPPSQDAPVRGQVIQGDVVATDTRPSTPDQRKQMFALWNELGFSGDENRENRLVITAKILGFQEVPDSSNDLTYGEMDKLIGELIRKRDAQRAGDGS